MKVIDLETHYSYQKLGPNDLNGIMIPVWNKLFNEDRVKTCEYIYITTIFPDKIKGPYYHTVRNSFLVCIEETFTCVVKESEEYSFFCIKPYQGIILPAKTEFCIYGSSKKEAILLNVCDFPWTPDTKECTIPDFSSLDLQKLERE